MRSRGFTLLEIIVAVAILAMGVGLSMQVFSGGLKNIRRISLAQEAMNHAENVMNEILSDESVIGPQEFSGELDEEFRYTAIVDYWEPPVQNLQLDYTENQIDLLSVVVDVYFKKSENGKRYRTICLKAVSLASESGLQPAVDPIQQLFGAQ